MISVIRLTDLDQYYSKSKIDIKNYLEWKKDKKDNKFLFLQTYNEEASKEFIYKRRTEINGTNKETIYLEKIFNLVNLLSINDFIVQGEYSGKWFNLFQHSVIKNSIITRYIYLRKIKKYIKNKFNNFDFSKFIDCFLVTKEINQFIAVFFPYSLILRKSDLICISLDLPLIIELAHDLFINFITIDKKIFDKILLFCKENCINHSVYDANSDFMKKVININKKYLGP